METRPFTFDDFGPALKPKGFTPFVTEEVPPEKRTYNAQDLLQAERAGHERGYKEGVEAGVKQGQTAEADTNQKLRAVMQTLEKKLDQFMRECNGTLQVIVKDTASLSLAIARKVAGEALNQAPQANIEALVKSCSDLLLAKEDIVLSLHPDILEPMQKSCDAMAERFGFKGKIHCKADPALVLHDCSIAWKDGGARLDTPGTWEKVETILRQQALIADAPAAAQPAPPEQAPVMPEGGSHG